MSTENKKNQNRVDIKKIDENTYQEIKFDDQALVNYHRSIKKISAYLKEIKIKKDFTVNHFNDISLIFDKKENKSKDLDSYIEKSLSNRDSFRGEIKEYDVDNIYFIKSRSYSEKDLYYQNKKEESIYIQIIGCEDVDSQNIFYGGISDRDAYVRIPSDHLREIINYLSYNPDSSIKIDLSFICFENKEKVLVEEDGKVFIDKITLTKNIIKPKDSVQNKEVKTLENTNISSIARADFSSITKVLWVIAIVMLINLIR